MTAAGGVVAPPRGVEWARPTRIALPLRALIASRLIVLGAGILGALLVPRYQGWSGFDPARISTGLGAVGNLLAAPAVRWDAIHYLTIAQHGYVTRSGTVFFPLYPLLIHALGVLGGSEVVAGVVISASSIAVALFLLHRLTELELGRRAADATVLLLAFSPMSFFFTAVYTESLFLALSLGSLLAARRGRPAIAAGLAALAALTRVTGILLVIPLALTQLARTGRVDRRLAVVLVAPAALLGYLGYVAARGFGWLAPFLQQTGAAHQHRTTGPIDTIASAVRAGADGLGLIVSGADGVFDPFTRGALTTSAKSIVLLIVLVLAGLALRLAFRRLPLAYAAYGAAALLVSIWSPVAGQPLSSLDRYVLTIFPLWMAAGAWLSERRLIRPVLAVSAPLLAISTWQFATWAFVA
jgi:hypothetical protein